MESLDFVRWLAKNGWVATPGSNLWKRVRSNDYAVEVSEVMSDNDLYSDFLKEHPVWKEASEPPESDRWVLICTNGGWVEKTYYSPDTQVWTNYHGNITHWRELPEGPK